MPAERQRKFDAAGRIVAAPIVIQFLLGLGQHRKRGHGRAVTTVAWAPDTLGGEVRRQQGAGTAGRPACGVGDGEGRRGGVAACPGWSRSRW